MSPSIGINNVLIFITLSIEGFDDDFNDKFVIVTYSS